MPSERLQVILELVTGQYKREAREAADATGQIGRSAQTATGPLGAMSQAWNKFAGPAAIIGAGVAVADFARDSIMAASDLEESVNAVNVVFGTAADTIHKFGETSADAVGLAAVNVNKAATVLGSSLINMGLDVDTAAAKTIELTTRASDMASVFNTTVPEALGAIQSALRGETDPIEKFGVSLTAAAVDAEAAALGYKKVAGEFSTTAKGAARMSLIMQQTDRVAGDFANTADSAANTMKRLNERFTETKARVGQALMPVFQAVLGVVEDLVPVFEDFALEAAGVVKELKPLIEGLGDLLGIYTDMKGAIGDATESQNPFIAKLGELGGIITSSGLSNLAYIFDAMQGPAGKAAEKMEDFKVASDNQDVLETSRTWIDKNREALIFMADASKDDAVPALIRLRDAQRDVEAATRAHRDALIQLTSRLLAQLNPALGAFEALQDLKQAQKDAADAAAIHGDNSDEAAEAQLRLAVATATAQGALNQFGDTEGAIRALADTLGITADEAAEILIQLGLITAKDWHTTLVIGVRTEGDLRALEQGVIPEGQGVPNPTTTLGGNRRAFGGPVRAGGSYLVGERGPEMFVSGSNGSIISNDVLKALGKGGNTYVVQSPMNDFRTDLQYLSIIGSVQSLVEAL